MNWVLPLVGCGGPAVSRCGHETRRHRVRGALFASVFASVLLAACGGGSGGNLTTSSEREPGPPGPGPLTATGDGGNESGEEQQQKIIVNQEEEQQQKIVVNIQPDPEESESEEESEEEENNNEETPQQLTIIEEVVPEYREPEKPKPTYSAQQQSQPESEEESEEEENNDEEQKIVVNIQPDPEESESEEESEEEENNNEETPQQLTIIEEVVPEYREPEKPKPTYSAQQQSQPESEEESEEEENNDEEQKIVVNIQPDPEESESEEESEEEENNNEETPQQLTIIEEVVPEYREPEKPKPTYSAQQQSQPESEEESEEEENNNNEEQKIVVNIQPDNQEPDNQEPEEESESESDNNDDEETPQQITIIEEPTYIPPTKEEPRYSASTAAATQQPPGLDPNRFNHNKAFDENTYEAVGSIGDFSYWMQDSLRGKYPTRFVSSTAVYNRNFDVELFSRNPLLSLEGRGPRSVCNPPSSMVASDCQTVNDFKLPKPTNKDIRARYHRKDGFVGTYYYLGELGNFVSDVDFVLTYNQRGSFYIDGYIGKDIRMGDSLTGGDAQHAITIKQLPITVSLDPKTGTATLYNGIFSGQRVKPPGKNHGAKVDTSIQMGTNTIKFALSKDGSEGNTKENLPNYLAGEVLIEGFSRTSVINAYRERNRLMGVFVADKK